MSANERTLLFTDKRTLFFVKSYRTENIHMLKPHMMLVFASVEFFSTPFLFHEPKNKIDIVQ